MPHNTIVTQSNVAIIFLHFLLSRVEEKNTKNSNSTHVNATGAIFKKFNQIAYNASLLIIKLTKSKITKNTVKPMFMQIITS